MTASSAQSPAAALCWFRDDLRLSDNPAFTEACRDGRPVAALYVLDEDSPSIRPLGGAARWWLAQSLRALGADLAGLGVPLVLMRGPAGAVVPRVMAQLGCTGLYFNGRSGAAEQKVDAALVAQLRAQGHEARGFNAHLLHRAGTLATAAGTVPRTFAAFQRAALKDRRLRAPLPVPPLIRPLTIAAPGEPLESFTLEPQAPDWAGGLRASWRCGERAAQARLHAFLARGLHGYAEGRDRPADAHVSRLSPHLRFGEVSPLQVLTALQAVSAAGEVAAADAEKFEAELYWREFSHHILAAEPDLARRNLQGAFDAFPWRECSGERKAWQRGRTGYPLIDAGMRELWHTGWMHNRVRMAVASFLSKHLLIDWREGEAWFWDTLVDADPASNPASWQWVAGSGVDAAPYFRIFNPVLQGEKFDSDGAYVRAHVPELARLPAPFIHRPWTADAATLARAGVRLGITYPRPMVDHAAARARALRAFEHSRTHQMA